MQEQNPQVVYSNRKRISPPQISPVVLVVVVVGPILGTSQMLEFRLNLKRLLAQSRIRFKEVPLTIEKFKEGREVRAPLCFEFFQVDRDYLARMDLHTQVPSF